MTLPAFGVEEELALLDPTTGAIVPAAAEVIAASARPERVIAESMTYMVETRTPVCRSLREASGLLSELRALVAAEATRLGAVAVSSGVAPYGVPDPPPVTAGLRYQRLNELFPDPMRTTGTCGCHVHVAVPNRQAAVDALLHLRPWLPALLALTCNSPIWEGGDTGWGSTRYRFMTKWPTGTPPPPVRCPAEYDRCVGQAVRRGLALDARSVYFFARLSPRYPTIEVRIGDACLSAAEGVMYAGLVRALVVRALELPTPVPLAPPISQEQLIRACRAVARTGLTARGEGADAVDALVEHVRPVLERFGDDECVLGTLHEVRLSGGGAGRQRRMFTDATTPAVYIAALAEATLAGVTPGRCAGTAAGSTTTASPVATTPSRSTRA